MLFLISRKIDWVLIVMLYELINKVYMWRFRFKLCLFIISFTIFLITRGERIGDMSEIIKLNRVCLDNVKILICEVFQIILIPNDLNLLLTRYSILQ